MLLNHNNFYKGLLISHFMVFGFKKNSINTNYMAGDNREPFYKEGEFSFFRNLYLGIKELIFPKKNLEKKVIV